MGDLVQELSSEEGESWLRFYGEHREAVRAALEAAGLLPGEAERRVGAVFARYAAEGHAAQLDAPVDVLRALAHQLAEEAAAEPAHALEP